MQLRKKTTTPQTKLNFKWKKGWETVDKTKGGYAETSYEYFERVPEVYLLKSKVADVWHIGWLNKGEMPMPDRLIYSEAEAQREFSEIKKFQDSELSRQCFSYMTEKEVEDWILEYGSNKYLGDSIYLYEATRALERFDRPQRQPLMS